MLVKKASAREIIVTVLFLLLLFLMCLESVTSIEVISKLLRYIDELITLFLFCYVLRHVSLILFPKKQLIVCWIALIFIGIGSSCIYRYQALVPVVVDAFVLSSRFIIGYLSATIYCRRNKKNISDNLNIVIRIVTIVLFILTIHDIFLPPFFAKSDYRYFMYGLQLMFPHATYLAVAAATLLIFLGYKNYNNKNTVYMIMATIVGVMTLRGKALAFFFIYWVLYLMIIVFKSKRYVLALPGGGIMAILIGWNTIVDNFNTSLYRPRAILMRDGIELMLSHFPFGTGFASFGSAMAATYYSPLYTWLGYPENKGMGPINSEFLHDGFWATICAQFGVFGLFFFIGIVLFFIKISIEKTKKNRYAGVAILTTMLYMLIASTAETAFFNPTALLMFMLLAIYEVEL